MDALILTPAQSLQPFPPKSPCLMTPQITVKLPPPHLLRLASASFRLFATTSTTAAPTVTGISSLDPELVTIPAPSTPKSKPKGGKRTVSRVRKVSIDAEQLKLNWLDSLSCPLPENAQTRVAEDAGCLKTEPGWVIGVDPDVSGALAVVKPDDSSQVFDSPHLKVLVGKRVRKRLDTKSIIQLLQTINAPTGTTAYIEQSIPFPQDGKQIDGSELWISNPKLKSTLLVWQNMEGGGFQINKGWWSSGFGYGLWIGILVASGYSVTPIPSMVWKNEFKLAGSRSSKDDSRDLASSLFPSLGSLLKRKKDHGRAEALLIAAYGKGIKVNHNSSGILEDMML